ncbi:MAG: 7-carboxy-7-deazaguanine synthase [Motiliproteus sp.]|jgi:7-carboxy-7-deazaguanine synthase
MYSVKELFYSLQGEGAHAGRAAVFCRFSGCNLWSGREQDRAQAVCNFCDTDFVGTDGELGAKYLNAELLAAAVLKLWNSGCNDSEGAIPYVICTGGEPLLQLDSELITAFKAQGFEVAVETNGTLPAPLGLDWICVSPKANSELRLISGNELKLVHPQSGIDPSRFSALKFDHFFLQPLDGPTASQSLAACLDHCRQHPRWRLSLQTHKLVNIP